MTPILELGFLEMEIGVLSYEVTTVFCQTTRLPTTNPTASDLTPIYDNFNPTHIHTLTFTNICLRLKDGVSIGRRVPEPCPETATSWVGPETFTNATFFRKGMLRIGGGAPDPEIWAPNWEAPDREQNLLKHTPFM